MKKIRAQMRKIKARRGNYWKPDKGKNIIRILPPWSADGFWYKDTLRHYVSFGEGPKKTIFCPVHNGDRCAVCDLRTKLRESKRKSDQKHADAIRPSLDFHVNMIDLKDKETGVQVGRLTETVVNSLLEYMMDADWGDFTDPRRGYNVIINREGEQLQTKYTVHLQRKQSRLEQANWLKELKDLDELYPEATYEETVAFLGHDDDEEEDEEYEDEEEEEEYEDEEDEDDE
jgi:hypothetical protein